MFEKITLVFSLVLLALNMGTHLTMRSFFAKNSKKIFWANTVIVCIFLIVLSGLQYDGWTRSQLTAYLLPPTTSISYFLGYVFSRMWSSHVPSFLISIIFIFTAQALNKKKENALFHDGEEWLLGSALFLSGFPGVVIFLPVFFLLFLFSSIIQTLRKGTDYRVSPYFLWLPTALCVILLVYLFFTDAPWWTVLRI